MKRLVLLVLIPVAAVMVIGIVLQEMFEEVIDA
jgi:hypothetical protein